MPAKKKTEVKMTPEILAKLKGVSVVSDTIDYVHEIEDVPAEFHPVFTLKAFSVEDSRKFKATQSDDQDLDEVFEEMVRSHLVSWDRLFDQSTGEPFEFIGAEDGAGADPDRYYTLPLGLRAKILQFLYSLSGII